MIEGLDISVENRYEILRDEDFLREYGPARRVVELLETSLSNGNCARTRSALAELGIKVDELDTEGSVRAYLDGLNQERLIRERLGPGKVNPKEEKFRIYYGKLALMCRVL